MEEEALMCAAVIVSTLAIVVADKRNWPEPKQNRLTARSSEWSMVRSHDAFSIAWFNRHLRCTRAAFEEICRRVSGRWSWLLPPLGDNAEVDLATRVAITLNYLGHGGAIYRAGTIFGVGKSICQTVVHQVVAVLNSFVGETIRPPSSQQEWEEVCRGFERVAGMPGVVGAADGCLIRIKRFADFDGWYCRRGYPTFNMMAVVDHKQRFMAFSLRNGAQNDKSVFNRSIFAREILPHIPPGTHLVGDAGYQLLTNVLTPYPILPVMEASKRWYNLVHSRTRIVVEKSFGRLKGKCRVFKSDLAQETPTAMASVIKSCLVLHNWFIDLDATGQLEDVPIEDWMEIDRVWWAEDEAAHQPSAKQKRDNVRECLFAARAQRYSATL